MRLRPLHIALGMSGLLLCQTACTSPSDPFSWAPTDSPPVARGREVAHRFNLLSAWEITLDLNNAFSPKNRRGIRAAEGELRKVPGVRGVAGPATLLDLSMDPDGKVAGRPLIAEPRGGGESEGEAIRQRAVRRADALGWFLSANGREVRFLLDVDDLEPVRQQVGDAITAAGLELLHPGATAFTAARLWPIPDHRLERWLAALASTAWILFMLSAGGGAGVWRKKRGRAAAIVIGVALAAGALFLLTAVAPVRALGVRAALVAGVVTGALLFLRRARRPDPTLPGRPPGWVVVASLLVLVAAAAVAPRLSVGTQQWRETPFLFVSVRGDFDQPVVLRELRRLTDYLRAEAGVAHAWSVADLFFGVQMRGEEVSRIPDSPDDIRRILVQARTDPAVRLELAPDHREALAVIRLDPEGGVDRLEVLRRLDFYLQAELRPALMRVDLGQSTLSSVTRSLGRGVLANDVRERILRICARSGRNLGDSEILTIDRVSRQAALLPTADLQKLKPELTAEINAFLDSATPSPDQVWQQPELVDALANQGGDVPIDEISRRLLPLYAGRSATDSALPGLARSLHHRMARVRRRHTARVNFREMLYGADLPTEGMLAEEVRSATLEAMGPVVGIPVPASTPAAFRIEAMAVGGAANDRALSDFLIPGLKWGTLGAAVALAFLLIGLAGRRMVFWWPVSLAPMAGTTVVPGLAREPVGILFLCFLAGTLAGGAAFALSLARRRW
jgi:hypothetical protein